MMTNKFKLTAVAFSVLSTCVYAEEMLDQINEYKLPPKQEVFKSGATSVRENISTSTQSIDDIIRTVPGAFTNLDKSSGTVSVNVRAIKRDLDGEYDGGRYFPNLFCHIRR